MSPPALMIAAPASGCGKTVVVLALLRAARRAGRCVASAKVGPDYIDPRFHEAASGGVCVTLDPWAMTPGTLARQLRSLAAAEAVLVEGVMGLFDGAADDTGSTADLAAMFGWPVLLILDVRAQGQSAAAVLRGFRDHRPGLRIAGVILNRVGSSRHEAMLRRAVAPLGLPVLGALPPLPALDLPSRHLGLVQAAEIPDLDARLDQAALAVTACIDVDAVLALAQPGHSQAGMPPDTPLAPPGQKIAVARDGAFAFAYPHLLQGWRDQGAELAFFAPLDGHGPPETADAVFLPGGYPELHAGSLAANAAFLDGLRRAAARGAVLYGECGGYMVLGRTLTDGAGRCHAMAGLLPVDTSIARPRRHLGYRRITLAAAGPLGPAGHRFRGHEFHYAEACVEAANGAPFAEAWDALGQALGPQGRVLGRVAGSFMHLIDRDA